MPPKDNAAMLVALGGLKKPKGKPGESHEPMGDDEEAAPDLKAEARADIASALESGDGEALGDAVERLVRQCMKEDEAGAY